jgi:hypothetical protein
MDRVREDGDARSAPISFRWEVRTMAPERARPAPAGSIHAGPVARVLIVDADAATHARCHLALRGLRVDHRPVQLLHARSSEDAADLLVLHPDVSVVVVGEEFGGAWLRRDDACPLRTIRRSAEGTGWDVVGDEPVAAGPDPAGAALHAAVLVALRQAGRWTVANAVRLG